MAYSTVTATNGTPIPAADINQLQENIDILKGGTAGVTPTKTVSQNTSDIATNTSDISTNASDISTNAGAISDIENGTTVIIPPIGTHYIQFPSSSGSWGDEPATLYGGGTWTQQFNDGSFFRSTGESDTRTSGLQDDAMQGHYHDTRVNSGSGGGAAQASLSINANTSTTSPTSDWVKTLSPESDGDNGDPRTASETRPTNRQIKIWLRTA